MRADLHLVEPKPAAPPVADQREQLAGPRVITLACLCFLVYALGALAVAAYRAYGAEADGGMCVARPCVSDFQCEPGCRCGRDGMCGR